MGKYSWTSNGIGYDREYHIQVAQGLNRIANELAEANRLTILQINLRQGLITERKEMRDQLVDQA